MFDGVALALPVRAEVTVGDLVADDVVVGDQEVVADRADRFGFAARRGVARSARRGRSLWCGQRRGRTPSAARSATRALAEFGLISGGRPYRCDRGTRPAQEATEELGTPLPGA